MAKYISKKEQVENTIENLKNIVNKQNSDIALPILKWTIEKIQLSYNEYLRNKRYFMSNRKDGKPRFVERGGIYRANLGKNVGSEQNGLIRPVLVVQEQSFNATSTTVLVIPLTDALDKNGKPKKKLKTHVDIEHKSLEKKSIIKVEHLRSISKNRLKDKVCNIDDEKMKEVEEKLKLSLGIK